MAQWTRRGFAEGGRGQRRSGALHVGLRKRCGQASPHFRILNNRTARHDRPDRNPIVVIPGLLRSRLRDPATGQIIWGAFDGQAANPAVDAGARALAAPIELDVAAGEPTGAASPDGVLDRVRVRLAGNA